MTSTSVPHPYIDDPDTPGACVICRRADPRQANAAHRLPDTAELSAEHRRRIGETEKED